MTLPKQGDYRAIFLSAGWFFAMSEILKSNAKYSSRGSNPNNNISLNNWVNFELDCDDE